MEIQMHPNPTKGSQQTPKDPDHDPDEGWEPTVIQKSEAEPGPHPSSKSHFDFTGVVIWVTVVLIVAVIALYAIGAAVRFL